LRERARCADHNGKQNGQQKICSDDSPHYTLHGASTQRFSCTSGQAATSESSAAIGLWSDVEIPRFILQCQLPSAAAHAPAYLQSSNAAGATALSVGSFRTGRYRISNYRVAVPSWRHFAVDRGRSEGEASSWLISSQNVKKSKKASLQSLFHTHAVRPSDSNIGPRSNMRAANHN
jgi:hypothetical protein